MRVVLRLVIILLVLVGGALAAAGALPVVLADMAERQTRSEDPAVRRRGLSYFRDERDPRGLSAVLERLERETDPDMVELAAYTAMRTRDTRAVAALMRRADREPDSPLQARIIFFAARLADGDYRLLPWLREGLASGGPWRQAGCATGLVQLGRIEGGDALLERVPGLPPGPREFALVEFYKVAEPMAEAVGQQLPALGPDPGGAFVAALQAFWQRHARAELLSDVLSRMNRNDAAWREVDRLLHARERVSRWLE